MLCNREDVFRMGLPRSAVTQPARALSAVLTTANVFELGSHNLQENTPVSLTVRDGRVPSPIVESAKLYAMPVNEDRFQLALLKGTDDVPAVAIALDDAGEGRILLNVHLGEVLDDWISFYSGWAITNTPGNIAYVANQPVPPDIRTAVAIRAGAAMARSNGKTIETLFEQERLLILDWAAMRRGVPIRASEQSGRANLAVGGSPVDYEEERVF